MSILPWARSPVRKYVAEYKSRIMPLINLPEQGSYDMKGRVPLEDFGPAGIVPRYDRYSGGDYFRCVCKGADISFSRALLEEKVPRGTFGPVEVENQYHTISRGGFSFSSVRRKSSTPILSF